MTHHQRQLSDLFTYDYANSVLGTNPEIIFRGPIILLVDLVRHDGTTVQAGTTYFEAWLELPACTLSFVTEDFETDIQINIRIEQDI